MKTCTINRRYDNSDFERFAAAFDRVWTAASPSVLPLDIWEKENVLHVRTALPGIRPEDIDVSIEESVLTIKGQHREDSSLQEAKIHRREVVTGSLTRSIRLPEDIDVERVEAKFDHGMVTISLPKIAPEAPVVTRIPVQPID